MEKPPEHKQWWAPVWKGLIVDSQAKHYRQMKSAVWLYLYLLVNANRQTGVLMRKIQTISGDMGVPRDTAIRWLHVLREKGYIATVNTGRSLTIQVARWKPLGGVGRIQRQKSDVSHSRYGKYPTPALQRAGPVSEQNGQFPGVLAAANDTKIQIYVHNDMRQSPHDERQNRTFTPIGEYARREALARELAHALDDQPGMNLYRYYCRKYPDGLLRNVLAEVLQVPAAQIKSSRGALFTYLVQHHAKRLITNPGH